MLTVAATPIEYFSYYILKFKIQDNMLIMNETIRSANLYKKLSLNAKFLLILQSLY